MRFVRGTEMEETLMVQATTRQSPTRQQEMAEKNLYGDRLTKLETHMVTMTTTMESVVKQIQNLSSSLQNANNNTPHRSYSRSPSPARGSCFS